MLYIMRHGRTDWNNDKKMQGRVDISLNEEGIRMAEEAAELYKDVPVDICFVSPLKRARETADIVLKGRDLPVIEDERLIEMGFGVYEGDNTWQEDPSSPIYTFFHQPEKYRPGEGGESFEELFQRTGDFLKKTVEPLLKEGKHVLIVGHGAMNSSIVCQVKHIPLERFWETGIQNCRLIPLTEEGETE